MSRNPAARGRADATQPEMVQWLEQQGHLVQDLHAVGEGCPDLLVGTTWGELVLVEVKTPAGRLEQSQQAWLWRWRGLPCCVPRSLAELRAWMERRRKSWTGA